MARVTRTPTTVAASAWRSNPKGTPRRAQPDAASHASETTWRGTLAIWGALVALNGCDPGRVTVVLEGSGSGTVSRSVVHLRASVAAEDKDLRDSLGWTEGVPDVEIRFLRVGTDEWRAARADQTGSLSLEDILPGLHIVYAARDLSPDEATRVGGYRRLFGDGRTLTLPGPGELDLDLLADQGQDLLISEVLEPW